MPRAAKSDRMQIAYLPLRDLVPYARNARVHPPEQLAQIKGSLLRFGWTVPMAVAGRNMIAGHGRLQCAIELAEEGREIPRNPDPWSGPVIDLSHLSETEQRAYVLADNRIALNAGWDDAILRGELAALRAEDFDVLELGFSDGDLLHLFENADGAAGTEPSRAGSLAAAFGIAPFSVLNAREGWWQDRKRAWLALGIRSELGRGAPIAEAASV